MTETNSQNYDVTSRANTATSKADLNTENPFTSHREHQTDTSDTMGGGLCYLGTFVLTDGSRNPRPDENGFRNFNSTNAT